MAEAPQTIIVGNWKMNGLRSDGQVLVQTFAELLSMGVPERCDIVASKILRLFDG